MGSGGVDKLFAGRSSFPGTVNLRDLGGFQVGAGQTRYGVLFRSAAPAFYSTEGLRHLEQDLGVAATVDFRGGDELRNGATRRTCDTAGAELLAHGSRWTNIDVVRKGMRRRLERRLSCGDKVRFLTYVLCCRRRRMVEAATLLLGLGKDGPGISAMYTAMIEDAAPELGMALREIAARCAAGVPTLFHCTAGKDRAGITAALVLALCGVAEPDIVADYACSARALTAHPEVIASQSPATRHIVHEETLRGSPATAMEGVLAALRRDHGGARGYVTGPCGVPEADVDRITRALLFDAPPAR